MLLNTTHVRPEEIQMRDKLSLEENELNSLGGHKGEENDSENENIENLKNMWLCVKLNNMFVYDKTK